MEYDAFLDLRERVRLILPDELKGFVGPGTRFGPPELRIRTSIWFDIFHEICSERFRVLFSDSDLTGLRFHDVQTVGRATTKLFALEAEFAELSKDDFLDFQENVQG